MWQVETEENVFLLKPQIGLSESDYGKGLPQGQAGDTVNGYAFYEFIEITDDNGKIKEVVLEYIASQMAATPTLIAVTPQQFKKWKKANIVAKPAKFVCK